MLKAIQHRYNIFSDSFSLEDEGEQHHIVEFYPVYWLLRAGGLWQPSNCSHIATIYHWVTLPIWGTCLIFILMMGYLLTDHYTLSVGELANSVTTALNLLCPYLFCRWYLSTPNFPMLLQRVARITASTSNTDQQLDANVADVADFTSLRRLVVMYSLSGVIHFLGSLGFWISHWWPLLKKPWHYPVYFTVLVFVNLWWACWLCLYSFVCHLHKREISSLIQCIKSDTKTIEEMVTEHQQVAASIAGSSQKLQFIVSLCVLYHSVDILIFTWASQTAKFFDTYPVSQFIGGLAWDGWSILSKLFPAAMVTSESQGVVLAAAGLFVAAKIRPATSQVWYRQVRETWLSPYLFYFAHARGCNGTMFLHRRCIGVPLNSGRLNWADVLAMGGTNG
eukprot:TRINITY_DN54773_c0_g1_i2.p1 TRINITY_DN54773_c0_g1~~TRINITY_DN54773_c0_g1_i2.p1  ORF type:complete len:392 (+),score=5.60 TRINITY_DN54773_c0_g1_i2:70-1245(+)